ncbi:hypothetical protein [Xanthomonas phaseoli]|uniref:hypothetical protein n=1 Tax=Xanthomonas phaseoli TaxID=1985254 RepID=UPI00036ADE96|nr:hypothetical protein [Xanthomonas phaseoli]KUF25949.1 hypothetical protein AO826_09210 [Xanthomonas phaseoli pv. manihotis]MCC8531221.1 hypothetical protein [Xanthomonas phaseoli]UEQ13724.1 hypothetical protein K9838_13455 [Xanthomonas phaseoli pv. manihotis]
MVFVFFGITIEYIRRSASRLIYAHAIRFTQFGRAAKIRVSGIIRPIQSTIQFIAILLSELFLSESFCRSFATR